ncbi:RHO alpha subunit C-terminal catalytic domain-containing protein ASCRUDRAFT_22743, partial [Ascoidea rubescens DSM 1968]
TLPASWYTSDKIVEIINKEVLHKEWLYLAPITRFFKENDETYVQYCYGNKPFFILSKYTAQDTFIDGYLGDYQQQVMPYSHNKDLLNEKLQALSKISTHVTKTGLVFINYQQSPKSTFSDHFGKELDPLINSVDFTKLKHKRTLTYKANYNVLTFLDGYQECLHCDYTHPGLSRNYNMNSYKVDNYKNFSHHLTCSKTNILKTEGDGLFLYFFPISTLSIYAGGMNCFRVIPIDRKTSRMEIDYYFNDDNLQSKLSDDLIEKEFENYFKFTRQVQIEDLDLCEATQENLEHGFYKGGFLNPEKESGVIFYQDLIRDRV